MLDYELLNALKTVVDAGSFQQAARVLHLTQSAVSQRIKLLEEQMGEPLVVRTNPPQATASGRRLIRHLQEVGLLESELALDEGPLPLLRIAVNADSLATWFFDAFSPIAAKRSVLWGLLVDNEDQTHHLLRRGEVFGCITSRERNLPGCESEYLGKMSYHCMCTPGFRKKYFAKGFDLKALQAAPGLIFDPHDKILERFLQKHFKRKNITVSCHVIPTNQAYFEMVARGLAFGMIPEYQSRLPLRRKKLVHLAQSDGVDVKLYFHFLRREVKAWREFRKEFVAAAQAALRQSYSA